MQKFAKAFLRLAWGAFLVLTSLYCLLAFLPYTYYALIKAPAYSWVPWFVHRHALLYWLVLAGAAWAYRPQKEQRRNAFFVCFAILATLGLLLFFKPFLATIANNRAAYWGGVAALWAAMLPAGLGRWGVRTEADNEPARGTHLSFAIGISVAAGIAVLSMAGAEIRSYADTRKLAWHAGEGYALFWSVVTHAVAGVILIAILNLIRIAAEKTKYPGVVSRGAIGVIAFGALWGLAAHFLGSALSFEGWPANLYAASFAAALTLAGFSALQPFLAAHVSSEGAISNRGGAMALITLLVVTILALALPTLLGGGDWNGLYQGSFTLLLWVVLGVCAFRLRRGTARYPAKMILVVLFVSVLSYKALQTTEIFWAKPLGSTDDDIQRVYEKYAERDASFNLAFRMLGNGRAAEPCGELCRVLREYTDIRNAQAKIDLKLVDQLEPARSERPNIFIFVVDSMRPDYLGAYNAKAKFTPNLDAFAQESEVVRNVYTPYAGTSLSEPAIWAGALLLHAHFMQPFGRLNSLEKLAKTDGYQMMVSYDEILSEILSPAEDLIKLDTDKKLWNEIEVCSTVQQAESALQHRPDAGRPVLFYTQPKNVHQFARNSLPLPKDENWPAQPGFNYRVSFELHQVDACLGGFFGWLKAHGLYDDSIIVVTSDHGDATGELGRNSHSLVIYPEIMRVPLMVHVPKAMEGKYVHDDERISALIDIAPTLYYLLGHRPIVANPLFGHPLLAESLEELRRYQREDLFLASDVRAAYGILGDNGRYLYATYDSPARSYLFDLAQDPNAEHDMLTSALKKQYDQQVIEHLQAIADFYGYKPGIGSLLASSR